MNFLNFEIKVVVVVVVFFYFFLLPPQFENSVLKFLKIKKLLFKKAFIFQIRKTHIFSKLILNGAKRNQEVSRIFHQKWCVHSEARK